MSEQYKAVSARLHDLEWLRNSVTHRIIKDREIHFGQPPILVCLLENGTCTQNELAKTLNVSPASVAVSLKRLQKSGLVEKVADQADLRCNRISLTEKGRREIEYVHKCFDEIDNTLFAGFSEAELSALCGYLDRLCKNLSADIPSDKPSLCLMQENLCKGGDASHGEAD